MNGTALYRWRRGASEEVRTRRGRQTAEQVAEALAALDGLDHPLVALRLRPATLMIGGGPRRCLCLAIDRRGRMRGLVADDAVALDDPVPAIPGLGDHPAALHCSIAQATRVALAALALGRPPADVRWLDL